MNKTYRFGILGAGVVAQFHARAIKLSERAELAAVCSSRLEKAQEFAGEFGAEQAYDDYAQMLKRDDIDVICICTPSGNHAAAGIAAAQAGKHVLVEKPLDIALEPIDALIDACARSGVKLGVIHQRRTMPAAVEAKKAIESGKLGRMVLGDAYLKYYRSPEYYKGSTWRGTWEMDGGGALMNQGIHGIDLLQWMMGGVKSVFAYAAPLVRDIEVEDTAVAVVRFRNGAFGVIQGTTSVYPGQEARFELHGDSGTISFSDSGIKQWVLSDGTGEMPEVAEAPSSSSDPANISIAGHSIQLEDMIDAIALNREPMVNGAEARAAVQLVLAIYESAKTGKEVFL
ncbi:Gfo/Idh/MocA family protein [Paenibacillus sp. MBLB4367]|uniref:Gfo/Idh/MocA family protein n=1 Tax=Paenibacillus sp. MBLB4367 TaxID=3384767 RepID=UPI0039080655